MASAFVNPLAQVAGFKNQQLANITNRQGTTPSPATTGMLSESQNAPMDTGVKTVSDRATRQHNLFLTALRAEQARRQPKVQGMNGSGGYSRNRTGAGGPAGFGRYGLTQGANSALERLNSAFRNQFGYDIKVNRGHRSYEKQAELYAAYKAGRGNLAAPPGKSVHQSGRAVDFGGALQNANSREHRWLQANAGAFGFKWTGKNFKQFEPWHWEWWG